MSHTDKDRPYWVRLNDEGGVTHHDHTRFGREQWRNRVVLDDNGKPILDEEPVMGLAREIVHNSGTHWEGKYDYLLHIKTVSLHIHMNILDKAKRLVSAGRGDEYFEVGTRVVRRMERYLFSVAPDHCTEGEKLSATGWRVQPGGPGEPHVELPCYPQFLPGAAWWHYGPTTARKYEHDRYYVQNRTEEREALTKFTKLWNSGEDLEDWDENYILDQETSSYMYW